MNKIRQFVKDNKKSIIDGAVVTGVVLGTYTIACAALGYRMVKPSHYDENYFYVTTLLGRSLKSELQ